MSRTTILLAVLGACLLALTIVGLAVQLPTVNLPLPRVQREAAVSVLIVASLIYAIAAFVVLRHESSRLAMWIVAVVAIVMRLALVFDHPALSSDIYRYVWDGQVQSAGINPYRYVPTDSHLKRLRDTQVFPLINRADYAHTIYPPAAEAIFALVGRITKTVTGMKIAMLAFELVACLCMLKILAIANLPAERILIYAWNPLVQWSFAYDGHVDAIAIGLLGLAMLCRIQHRSGLAGAFLAGAALVKFFPVVIAPAFVRGDKFWRPALVGSFIIVLLYALYSSVGFQVFGFLSGYNDEEGLTNGTGIWLLSGLSALNDHTDLVDLPDDFGGYYLLCAAAFMLALGVWIARRPLKVGETDSVRVCRDTAFLAAWAQVLISPHFPWYFAWLALPAVVAPSPAVVWLAVAPVVLYLDPGTEHALWGSFVYVPVIGWAAYSLWTNRPVNRTWSSAFARNR
jgi:hypothetical protein